MRPGLRAISMIPTGANREAPYSAWRNTGTASERTCKERAFVSLSPVGHWASMTVAGCPHTFLNIAKP